MQSLSLQAFKQSSSPSSPSPFSQETKSVSFGKDEIYETDENEYSNLNPRELWWAADEKLEIRKEYEAVLHRMETSQPINEDHHSARGLEKRTEDSAWALFETLRDARHSVLDAQDKHRRKKDASVDIRKAYERHSEKSSIVAHEVALADALQVHEYLREALTFDTSIDQAAVCLEEAPLEPAENVYLNKEKAKKDNQRKISKLLGSLTAEPNGKKDVMSAEQKQDEAKLKAAIADTMAEVAALMKQIEDARAAKAKRAMWKAKNVGISAN